MHAFSCPLDRESHSQHADSHLEHLAHQQSPQQCWTGTDVWWLALHGVCRGGVPVCFPQFGQLGPLGQHGFARNSSFRLLEETADSATLVSC